MWPAVLSPWNILSEPWEARQEALLRLASQLLGEAAGNPAVDPACVGGWVRAELELARVLPMPHRAERLKAVLADLTAPLDHLRGAVAEELMACAAAAGLTEDGRLFQDLALSSWGLEEQRAAVRARWEVELR